MRTFFKKVEKLEKHTVFIYNECTRIVYTVFSSKLLSNLIMSVSKKTSHIDERTLWW